MIRPSSAKNYETLLRLTSQGLSAKEVAKKLGLDLRLVNRRLQYIRHHLNAKNTTHAVAMFIQAQYEAPSLTVFEWINHQSIRRRMVLADEEIDYALAIV